MKNPFRYLTVTALDDGRSAAPGAGSRRAVEAQRPAPCDLRSRRLRLGAAVRDERDALHEQRLPATSGCSRTSTTRAPATPRRPSPVSTGSSRMSRPRTRCPQVDVLAHSRGTTVMHEFLSTPARAANVRRYVNFDGRTSDSPPGGVPTLAVWGEGDQTRAIGGATNAYFPTKAHTEVTTSAEAFAEVYKFLNRKEPEDHAGGRGAEDTVKSVRPRGHLPGERRERGCARRDLSGRSRDGRAPVEHPGACRHGRRGRLLRPVQGQPEEALRVRGREGRESGPATTTPSRSSTATTSCGC